MFLNYQEKFDINYWKLDGMLLNPSTTPSQYHVTGKDEYVFTETFERWTDMVEMMRDQRGGKDLWINMTSYTNPSPWLLQWVNSIFMQDTGDMGALKVNEDDTMEQQYLNYRDSDYYEFFNEIGWQLPAKQSICISWEREELLSGNIISVTALLMKTSGTLMRKQLSGSKKILTFFRNPKCSAEKLAEEKYMDTPVGTAMKESSLCVILPIRNRHIRLHMTD